MKAALYGLNCGQYLQELEEAWLVQVSVRDDLEVGLLSPSLGRQLLRLPAGNHAEVLDAAHREALTVVEVQGVVDLWLGVAGQTQRQHLLA